MAKAIVTIKIMPSSPEVNLDELETTAKKFIAEFAGEGETKSEITPVAFGLKSLSIIFVMEESLGSPDGVAEKLGALEKVNSAEVTDVRRALG